MSSIQHCIKAVRCLFIMRAGGAVFPNRSFTCRTLISLLAVLVLVGTACSDNSDKSSKNANATNDSDSSNIGDKSDTSETGSDNSDDSDSQNDGGETPCLRLIDSVNAAAPDGEHAFREEPNSHSVVETLLNKDARVLPPTMDMASYVAFKMGKGKGLEGGKAYLLTIEYPDDAPRTTVVVNRGTDQIRTFSTGIAIGDYREQYAYPNPESLAYPHSGEWKQASFYFHLNERFQDLEAQRNAEDVRRPFVPEDGFWVAIGQFNQKGNPREDGAAVGTISLYEVIDASQATLEIQFPPSDLPRRHMFWREEMNDTSSFCKADDRLVLPTDDYFSEVCNPATADPLTWFNYKMKLSNVLGFNTYATDLLEFGHNQGWDATDFGGGSFFYNSSTSYWNDVLALANAAGLDVLPMYEYYGSLGSSTFTTTTCSAANDPAGDAECVAAHGAHSECLDKWAAGVATPTCGMRSYGYQRRCRPLADRDLLRYTGVWWTEDKCLDVTDPASITDVQTLLDATVLAQTELADILGVWMRTRVNSWPMSFSDETLVRFSTYHGSSVDRAALRTDESLRAAYYDWWFAQRYAYVSEIRDYLQGNGLPDANVLFTPYHAEGYPAASISGVVTDDKAGWDDLNSQDNWQWRYAGQDFDTWLSDGIFEESIATFIGPTNAALANLEGEMVHSVPNADPERYASAADINITMPFGRMYTVADADLLERFRTPSGLAIIRHYPLNEGDGSGDIEADQAAGSYDNWPMSGHFGYFVSDVDRAGPHSMLAETRAVANGDPTWIGYLSSGIYNSIFPTYLRQFSAAFLALPALPSERLADGASDSEVVVRTIDGGSRGTYVAVANTSMDAKTDVSLNLPAGEPVYNLVTGAPWSGESVNLYSGQLLALRIGGDLEPPLDSRATQEQCFLP